MTYTATGNPTTQSRGASKQIRDEFELIETDLALKATIADPVFTGNPRAPTPAANDNDTSIATTAFVDTSFAKKASPTFTGTPIAPTAAGGTNTTQIATTAFVIAEAFSTALPTQTGNAGKYITTDGTNASWGALADVAAQGVGTYCFCLNFSGGAVLNAGGTTAGSNLRVASVTGTPTLITSGAGLTGTWRAMGEILLNNAGICQRTA